MALNEAQQFRAKDLKTSRAHYNDYLSAAKALEELGLIFSITPFPRRSVDVDPRFEIRYANSPEMERVGGFEAIERVTAARRASWEVENGPHARSSSNSGVPFQGWIARASEQADRNMRTEAERIARQARMGL